MLLNALLHLCHCMETKQPKCVSTRVLGIHPIMSATRKIIQENVSQGALRYLFTMLATKLRRVSKHAPNHQMSHTVPTQMQSPNIACRLALMDFIHKQALIIFV